MNKTMHGKAGVALATGLLATAVLVACGGGSQKDAVLVSNPASSGSTATALAVSSGTITAFGSVFVNGHEFATDSARLIDDDTGLATSDLSALEVGTAVDLHVGNGTNAGRPMADELHMHPLVRGVVDASNTSASTLSVMGQTVQLSAATNFVDRRACVAAITSPCTAITGQSGLAVTSGSGSTAVAGSYVSIDGYLLAGSSSTASVVATLVALRDVPATGSAAAYKVEGAITAVGSSSLHIGALTVDLTSASCSAGSTVPCKTNFTVGQVVSAFSDAAPALPARSFAASRVRLAGNAPTAAAGASLELEGRVVSVSGTRLVLRGLTVDLSGLSGTAAPAAGDDVRVAGVLSSDGTVLKATALTLLHAALSASYGLEGNFATVTAGAAANTWVLSLLGQSVAVDATTRLADETLRGAGKRPPAAGTPFNINSFQTYLAASASKHLLVRAQSDAAGALKALSVTIAPVSGGAGISGPVDAAPAPVNSSSTGTPSTFSVHGLPVKADPAAFLKPRGAAAVVVAAGDYVLVRGTESAGSIIVAAPSGGNGLLPMARNVVIDLGAVGMRDRDPF